MQGRRVGEHIVERRDVRDERLLIRFGGIDIYCIFVQQKNRQCNNTHYRWQQGKTKRSSNTKMQIFREEETQALLIRDDNFLNDNCKAPCPYLTDAGLGARLSITPVAHGGSYAKMKKKKKTQIRDCTNDSFSLAVPALSRRRANYLFIFSSRGHVWKRQRRAQEREKKNKERKKKQQTQITNNLYLGGSFSTSKKKIGFVSSSPLSLSLFCFCFIILERNSALFVTF